MGRDFLMLNLPEAVKSISQLAEDLVRPLGSHDYVLEMLSAAFPDTDVSDPGWIFVTHRDYSLSFSLGHDEPVEVLLITVHGKQSALDEIRRFCGRTGWRAFDSSTGDFLGSEKLFEKVEKSRNVGRVAA